MNKINFKTKINKFFKELSDFDFRELDLKEVGEWPISIRIFFAILLVSFILSIGYFVQFKKMNTLLKVEKAKETQLFTTVDNKIYEASHLEPYRIQIKEMKEKFVDEVGKLPINIEMSGLVQDITSSGSKYGLEFDKIILIDEKPSSFYIELPIELTVRGTYHSFGQFLSELTQLSRIITLHDFTIVPSVKYEGMLEMTIVVKTYKYNPNVQENLEKLSGQINNGGKK